MYFKIQTALTSFEFIYSYDENKYNCGKLAIKIIDHNIKTALIAFFFVRYPFAIILFKKINQKKKNLINNT